MKVSLLGQLLNYSYLLRYLQRKLKTQCNKKLDRYSLLKVPAKHAKYLLAFASNVPAISLSYKCPPNLYNKPY